jgi:translation initiation factor 1
MEARRFGKPSTIIEGLNMSKSALQDLSRRMKKRLATGGTVEDQSILLQGDHRNKAAKILVELGFPENTIQVV